MAEPWDVENFEPKLPTGLKSSNKWEGEDEEEIVKESWEDEEEENKDKEKLSPPAPKPKKQIHNKIAEKERLQREKAERLAAERVTEDMSPEQELSEKLRRQKLQVESDLRLATETCGITNSGGRKIDNFEPTSKEEFAEFTGLLVKKITQYKAREEYPEFTDEILRSIVAPLSSLNIRRIKLTVDNLCIEKQKAEKNEKSKKPTKGKGKAKLKIERDNAHLTQYDAYDNYEADFDDFM